MNLLFIFALSRPYFRPRRGHLPAFARHYSNQLRIGTKSASSETKVTRVTAGEVCQPVATARDNRSARRRPGWTSVASLSTVHAGITVFLGHKYPTQRCQHGRETPVGRAQTACFTFYFLRANRKNLSGGDQYEDELTLAQHAYRFAALETRHPCSSVVHFAVTEQMGSVESVQRRQGHATAPTTCGIAASNSDRCLRSKQAGGVQCSRSAGSQQRCTAASSGDGGSTCKE